MHSVALALNPPKTILQYRDASSNLPYWLLFVPSWLVCVSSAFVLAFLYGVLGLSAYRWRAFGGGPDKDELQEGYAGIKEPLDALCAEEPQEWFIRLPIMLAERSLAVIKDRLDDLLMAEAAQHILECLEEYEIAESGQALLVDG